MIMLKGTPNGIGVKLLGDYADICALYDTLSKFYRSNDEDIALAQCGRILTVMGYEARHAYQHDRLCEKIEFDSDNTSIYYGFHTDWITLMFTLACLKRNISMPDADNLDKANCYLLFDACEYLLDNMNSKNIMKCIDDIPVKHRLVYFFHQYALRDFYNTKPESRIKEIPKIIHNLCHISSPDFHHINDMWKEILIKRPEELGDYELDDNFSFPDYDKW